MVLRVRPATAPVAINARAAVRAEIGGVERFTRELALRLPALRPDRYSVVRPPRALAHRSRPSVGTGRAPGADRSRAELILSPANLAPAASRRNVVVIHDAAALRHPEAYSGSVRRLPPPDSAAARDRRARLVLTPSEFSRGELIELLGADPRQRSSSCRRGSMSGSLRQRIRGRPAAGTGLSGRMRSSSARVSDRKNLVSARTRRSGAR